MEHALALGRRGLGRVGPWPSVGCVIVNQGRVVGRGTSDLKSLRHAEIVALDQARENAHGATVYVTLEPCSHHGKTPPCADALIAAGVARVVVATGDPNPLVTGQGLKRLRAAGIAVETGFYEAQARHDNAGFLSVQERSRPHLTLKLATTLDGRIATSTGESRWITGPEARRKVHGLRASHDCVMVGGGTARADDPTLTVRDADISARPVRLVVTRKLSLPWPNKLVDTIDHAPVWIAHGKDEVTAFEAARWSDAGARLIPIPTAKGQLQIAALLGALADHGLTRILCEGGGALSASLLKAGVVDDLVVFTAGKVLGADAHPAIGALDVSQLLNAPQFTLKDVSRIGDDIMQHWCAKTA